MSTEDQSPRVKIAIAIITVVGTVLVGLFANWDKVFSSEQTVSPLPDSPTTIPSSPPSPVPSTATSSSDYQLTGVWKDDSRDATFYIRHIDPEIWWYGEGTDWGVVVHGTWDGNQFRTNSADVPIPGKKNLNSGNSTISIIDSNKLLIKPGDDNRKEYYLIRE